MKNEYLFFIRYKMIVNICALPCEWFIRIFVKHGNILYTHNVYEDSTETTQYEFDDHFWTLPFKIVDLPDKIDIKNPHEYIWMDKEKNIYLK